jgi:hypothetical protein
MKIVREDVKVTRFGDVAVGSVFIEDDIVFMKTLKFYEIEEDGYEEEARYAHNAIRLSTGEFSHFTDYDMVKVCNDAQLVVK